MAISKNLIRTAMATPEELASDVSPSNWSVVGPPDAIEGVTPTNWGDVYPYDHGQHSPAEFSKVGGKFQRPNLKLLRDQAMTPYYPIPEPSAVEADPSEIVPSAAEPSAAGPGAATWNPVQTPGLAVPRSLDTLDSGASTFGQEMIDKTGGMAGPFDESLGEIPAAYEEGRGEVDAMSTQLADAAERQRRTMEEADGFYRDSMEKLKSANTMYSDAVNQGIDPNRVFNSGVLDKTMAGLSVLASGYGARLDGPNPAMELIQKTIDRDIDAQKVQLNARGEYANNMLSTYTQAFGNRNIAEQALRSSYLDMAENRARALQTRVKGMEEKERIGQAISEISAKKTEVAIQMQDAMRKESVERAAGRERERSAIMSHNLKLREMDAKQNYLRELAATDPKRAKAIMDTMRMKELGLDSKDMERIDTDPSGAPQAPTGAARGVYDKVMEERVTYTNLKKSADKIVKFLESPEGIAHGSKLSIEASMFPQLAQTMADTPEAQEFIVAFNAIKNAQVAAQTGAQTEGDMKRILNEFPSFGRESWLNKAKELSSVAEQKSEEVFKKRLTPSERAYAEYNEGLRASEKATGDLHTEEVKKGLE